MILFLEQFITGSLCLFLALSGLLSGSLSLAHSGSSLAHSGSLWLTLAHSGSLSGSLWLSLAHSGLLSGSLWLSLALWLPLARCPAHSGSLWLSLACSPALSGSLLLALALSGSLLLSEFAYNILARLTRPLLSSQRRCCAATLYAALAVAYLFQAGVTFWHRERKMLAYFGLFWSIKAILSRIYALFGVPF